MRRRIPSSANSRSRVDMAITRIQDTLNATRVVDGAVLVREATAVTTGLYGIVVSRASLPRLGSRKLVGARVAAAREFADGGHDQGPDAGYGGGDDDDCVFDVAPAEELEATGGAEIGDAGDGGEFGGFDDGGDHGAKTIEYAYNKRKGGSDVQNTQTEEDDETDLDAHFQVEVPENECGEDGQKQVTGGVCTYTQISMKL